MIIIIIISKNVKMITFIKEYSNSRIDANLKTPLCDIYELDNMYSKVPSPLFLRGMKKISFTHRCPKCFIGLMSVDTAGHTKRLMPSFSRVSFAALMQ